MRSLQRTARYFSNHYTKIMERTLVILKPSALQRGIVGEVISRFEKRGLKLVALKMARLDDEILAKHYDHIND